MKIYFDNAIFNLENYKIIAMRKIENGEYVIQIDYLDKTSARIKSNSGSLEETKKMFDRIKLGLKQNENVIVINFNNSQN